MSDDDVPCLAVAHVAVENREMALADLHVKGHGKIGNCFRGAGIEFVIQ